ncbi:PAS domain-containing sensor histidine kinase [Polaromonas sp. YR568]|uniref:PAS domain-containing sensor histidine kinase n=1 Tax=Polaromonas sp. YR568 TaxID=1855301 RepID=UPI00313791B1
MSLFPHVGDAVPKRKQSMAIVLAVIATLTFLAVTILASRQEVASRPLLFIVVALAATSCGMSWLLFVRNAARDREGKQALEGADARLAGLLDSAMDAIITVDSDQNVILYNKAAERIFGWPTRDMLGQPLTRLIPQRHQGAHGGQVKRFGQTGTTSRRMGDGTVLNGRRSNGEEFPLEASISQLDTAHGKLYTVILRDVTERVRASEELSAFASAAHAIRESEKTRIARELHDELAQSLTAIKMDATWIREAMPPDSDAVRAKLDDMLGLLDTTVAATRRIASDLRPLLLDDLGLGPAIQWLTHNFSQRHGVPCKLSLDEEVELGEPYATAVFRIVQESLVNVAKHSGASQVEVRIARTATAVVLEVNDNGAGFSPDAPRKAGSLGLMGLRERARLLQGTVDIDTAPGRGTQIRVSIPVPETGDRGEST